MCVRIAVDFEYSGNIHIKVCLYVSVCMQECWVIHHSLPWSDAGTHTAQQKGSLIQSWPPAGIEKVSLSPSLFLYSCWDSQTCRWAQTHSPDKKCRHINNTDNNTHNCSLNITGSTVRISVTFVLYYFTFRILYFMAIKVNHYTLNISGGLVLFIFNEVGCIYWKFF